MNRILLLLDHEENQQLLARELRTRNEVVVGSTDDDLDDGFDLCVLDGRALDRLWQRVLELKDRVQPIFLPIVLVTARPDVKMITRQVWRSVDELVITPIEKPELHARVEVLLRARTLSKLLRVRAEEAERAARARDEVLAVVSHDLRNPLNLVMTNAELLLDTATERPQSERALIDMIRRAADQMHRLIRDLLQVAAIEAGSMTVEPASESAWSIVEEACSTLAHVARAKDITLSFGEPRHLPPVTADRDRILQVLGNLIGNALKFTPEGGRIDVAVAETPDALVFSVADSGSGIDPEDLPHIFDRFWQARHARAAGAGLGLAICRGIVQAHGGELWATSEPGNGSTFSFTLPRSG